MTPEARGLQRWGKTGIGLVACLGFLAVCGPVWAVPHHTLLSPPAESHGPPACHHATVSNTTFFALLGAGFLTGLSHCIGMCGPLVGAFALRRRAARQEITAPLVLSQLGRLSTYGLLGTAAGGIGAVSAVHDWQGIFAVVMGLLAILLGLGLFGCFPAQHWLVALLPLGALHAWMTRWMASAHPGAPFVLGLANGLLPCGPVYTVASLAALSADPFKGASLMLLFGFGTLPSMLGLGFSIGLFSMRVRQHLYRLAAMLVLLVGVQLTLRGLALSGYIPHTAMGNVMLW